jgi:hypothetical protein
LAVLVPNPTNTARTAHFSHRDYQSIRAKQNGQALNAPLVGLAAGGVRSTQPDKAQRVKGFFELSVGFVAPERPSATQRKTTPKSICSI